MMKIRQLIVIGVLFNSLMGLGEFIRPLNYVEQKIVSEEVKVYYLRARSAYQLQGTATSPDDRFLKVFLELYNLCKSKDVVFLIQKVGEIIQNPSQEDEVCCPIPVYFIAEKAVEKKLLSPQNIEVFNFKTKGTYENLYNAIKKAKEWADTQPGGSNAKTLVESFQNTHSEIFQKLLGKSKATWKLETPVAVQPPVIPVQEPKIESNPNDVKEEPVNSQQQPREDKTESNAQQSEPVYGPSSSFHPLTDILNLERERARQAPLRQVGQGQAELGSVNNVDDLARNFPLKNILEGNCDKEMFKACLAALASDYQLNEDNAELNKLTGVLAEHLAKNNLEIIPTPGLGNCAFDAALLSWFCRKNLYKPEWDCVLGEYIERSKNIEYFRKIVGQYVMNNNINLSSISRDKIVQPNEWVSAEIFKGIAVTLSTPIILFYTSEKTDKVCITCYSEIAETSTVDTEKIWQVINGCAIKPLLIAFKDSGHFMALRSTNVNRSVKMSDDTSPIQLTSPREQKLQDRFDGGKDKVEVSPDQKNLQPSTSLEAEEAMKVIKDLLDPNVTNLTINKHLNWLKNQSHEMIRLLMDKNGKLEQSDSLQELLRYYKLTPTKESLERGEAMKALSFHKGSVSDAVIEKYRAWLMKQPLEMFDLLDENNTDLIENDKYLLIQLERREQLKEDNPSR